MALSRAATVGVGVPVFNGGRYIAAALSSVLAQTYRDLRIIICDNGSTDGTQQICETYQGLDDRVRYVRNAENIGASPNYNKCFALSECEYFLWIAHDDMIEATFVERCVEVLERSPALGLCHTGVRLIDEHGQSIGALDNALPGTCAKEPWRRLRSILREDPYCQSVFSLYRTDMLRKTGLMGSHHNSDRVLLAEAALLAPFGYVAEPLFSNRIHDQRYTSRVKAGAWTAWHDPLVAGKRQFPLWKAYARYVDAVGRLVRVGNQRLLCQRELILWWFVGANAGHMLIDALAAYEPRVFTAAQKVKHRIFGSRAEWLIARGRKTPI